MFYSWIRNKRLWTFINFLKRFTLPCTSFLDPPFNNFFLKSARNALLVFCNTVFLLDISLSYILILHNPRLFWTPVYYFSRGFIPPLYFGPKNIGFISAHTAILLLCAHYIDSTIFHDILHQWLLPSILYIFFYYYHHRGFKIC